MRLSILALMLLLPVASAAAQGTPSFPDEDLLWQAVRNSRAEEDIAFYLRRFPKGAYVVEAERRLAALRAPPPAPSPSAAQLLAAELRSGVRPLATFEGTVRFAPREYWLLAWDKSGDLVQWRIAYQGFPIDCPPLRVSENSRFDGLNCRGAFGYNSISLFLSGTIAGVTGVVRTEPATGSQLKDFPVFSMADIVAAEQTAVEKK